MHLDELAAELANFAPPEKQKSVSPIEARVVAGFEEVQAFVDREGRLPELGEDREIFERLYATRLDQLRRLEEYRPILEPLDRQGLFKRGGQEGDPSEINIEELARELQQMGGGDDLTELKHVRSYEEIQATEELARRERCLDFDRFQPLFEAVRAGLKSQRFTTVRFWNEAKIQLGEFFILSGQMVYIDKVGDFFVTPGGKRNARLRVIFDNGTESDLLSRSLERALYKDEAGRRIVDMKNKKTRILDTLVESLAEPGTGYQRDTTGPFFDNTWEEGDEVSGRIYVLRSLSDQPYIAKNREVVHKIGVTTGELKTRFSNAVNDPTFLLAEVEIVGSYQLVGIKPHALERLIHRFFAPAQLDIEILDRFGKPVQPREWFVVPLRVIEKAVDLILQGVIDQYRYDPEKAQIVKV